LASAFFFGKTFCFISVELGCAKRSLTQSWLKICHRHIFFTPRQFSRDNQNIIYTKALSFLASAFFFGKTFCFISVELGCVKRSLTQSWLKICHRHIFFTPRQFSRDNQNIIYTKALSFMGAFLLRYFGKKNFET